MSRRRGIATADRLQARFCRGDLVQVRPEQEILATLDEKGTLGSLPFMPEMSGFCGQRFRVARRVLVTCGWGLGSPRGFPRDDVVTLEGLRCSGSAHDGCQKACQIFWRDAWLQPVSNATAPSTPGDRERLDARLTTKIGPTTYFCQASELGKVSIRLQKAEVIRKYIFALLIQNLTLREWIHGILTWVYQRVRGPARGSSQSTPVESLNLQPGEWVEVKSMEEILKTLNTNAKNRGLQFTRDMRRWAGQRHRVNARIDKIIDDGTGQMRQMHNTVSLVGITCGCRYMAIGMAGCSRCEFTYWREIWLRRSQTHSSTGK